MYSIYARTDSFQFQSMTFVFLMIEIPVEYTHIIIQDCNDHF